MQCPIYMSQLQLTRRNPHANRDLNDVYRMHERIADLFGQAVHGQPRALYRVEGQVVTVQYPNPPDWTRLPAGYLGGEFDLGFEGEVGIRTKRIDAALDSLARGTALAFRLKASPVVTAGRNSTLKRTPITDEAGALAWLFRQGDRHGFEVPIFDGMPDVRVVEEQLPPGRKVSQFSTMLFEGCLRVRDPEALRHAVTCGVGRYRAFGLGLLTLSRLRI